LTPKILKKSDLIVIGSKGKEFETGAVWQKFLDLYDKYGMYEQLSSNEIYKIKLFMDKKTEVYIGMLSNTKRQSPFYRNLIIPENEYAVFEIALIDGYKEKLNEIDEWIKTNKKYDQAKLNDNRFLIEHYGKKFDENDFENSKIDVWVPIVKKQ